jgi:hypothetical protein
MSWDVVFAEEVETVLRDHCRARKPGACGSAAGYKNHGGRCRAFRTAKRGAAAVILASAS